MVRQASLRHWKGCEASAAGMGRPDRSVWAAEYAKGSPWAGILLDADPDGIIEEVVSGSQREQWLGNPLGRGPPGFPNPGQMAQVVGQHLLQQFAVDRV